MLWGLAKDLGETEVHSSKVKDRFTCKIEFSFQEITDNALGPGQRPGRDCWLATKLCPTPLPYSCTVLPWLQYRSSHWSGYRLFVHVSG